MSTFFCIYFANLYAETYIVYAVKFWTKQKCETKLRKNIKKVSHFQKDKFIAKLFCIFFKDLCAEKHKLYADN